MNFEDDIYMEKWFRGREKSYYGGGHAWRTCEADRMILMNSARAQGL